MGHCITDVNVLVAYDKNPVPVPTGWKVLDTDLNSGVSGDYLYLVHERCDQDHPITDIRVLVGDEKPPKGYEKIPVDLNKGAVDADSGKPHPLFMAVTRTAVAGHPPIEDLRIASWVEGDKKVDPPSGYSRINADLNAGVSKIDGAGKTTTTHIYLDRKPAAS
ncbi:hypothetical protein ACFWJ4_03540 [Kitasatospora sp. NPDC127067]|uniref:hypothetical protein n=1 Tax=Kitasatospora sp. NPDC127067 TaxID=3347126 RepID=UPI003666A001